MARQHGQFTFETPSTATLGDNLADTATLRIFTAYERCTVVEVGVIPDADAPDASFSFRALKRVGGSTGSDTVISVFKSQFAAEGGVAGDPSILNFDEANKIPNGVITNTLALAEAGKALRAYCEVTLNKGDQIVLDVVAASGTAATGVFYAKAYPGGAGLVDDNDVESN